MRLLSVFSSSRRARQALLVYGFAEHFLSIGELGSSRHFLTWGESENDNHLGKQAGIYSLVEGKIYRRCDQ